MSTDQKPTTAPKRSVSEEKRIIAKNCLTYGAFDTARRISSSPAQCKILIEYLVEEGFATEAALIVQSIFEGKAPEDLSDALPEVPEGYTRNQMVNKFHEELTGEKISVSRKRLKNLRRDKRNVTRASKLDERIAAFPTQSESGLEFLTLKDLGVSEAEYSIVDSLEAFEEIKAYWEKQTHIGFNAMFNGPKVSLISLASESKVTVFDIYLLYKEEAVKAFFKDLLVSKDIEKVTHSFTLAVSRLEHLFQFGVKNMVKIIELTSTIVNSEDKENKLGRISMAEKYLKKSINSSWKSLSTGVRPIHQKVGEYAAVLACANLKILDVYEAEDGEESLNYFDYVEPETPVWKARKPRNEGDGERPRRGRRSQGRGGKRRGRGGKRVSRPEATQAEE